MNRIDKIKNENGSALVAVLLVMLMLSAISLSIISRTKNNLQMSIETRRSQNAYQTADLRAEAILNMIRGYDSLNDASSTTTNILSDISISDLCNKLNDDFTGNPCSDWDIAFYKVNSNDAGSDPDKMSTSESITDIIRVDVGSTINDAQVARAVSVPTQTRVIAPQETKKTANLVGACSSCSGSQACFDVAWKYPSGNNSEINGFVIKDRDSSGKFSITGDIKESDLGTVCLSNNECTKSVCLSTGSKAEAYIKSKSAKNFMLDSADMAIGLKLGDTCISSSECSEGGCVNNSGGSTSGFQCSTTLGGAGDGCKDNEGCSSGECGDGKCVVTGGGRGLH